MGRQWPASRIGSDSQCTLEGFIPWTQVEIPGNDIADVEAVALIGQFEAVYRRADLPPEVSVHHCVTDDGGHVYYFSPAASAIAGAVFARFNASDCAEPDLTGCKAITL